MESASSTDIDTVDTPESISADLQPVAVAESITPSRKRRHVDVDVDVDPDPSRNDDEGTLCSICLDVWTSSGAHRLCALRCGHLFGRSCVIRWLSGKQKMCPQCNAPARKNDVREIYATKLIVLDTSEVENLRLQNSQLQSEIRELSMQLDIQKTLVQFYKSQSEKRTDQIATIEHTSGAKVQGFETRVLASLRLDEGLCRVLAYCKQRDVISVSQEHTGPLWPGFGVRLISTQTDQISAHQPIHKKELRDLVFHPRNPDLLLTVALDQYVKVTDVSNNKTVFSWKSDNRLWSCCWDSQLDGVIYVGTERGLVVRIAMESTVAEATINLPLPLDKIKPVAVISLISCRRLRAVLCCRLLSISSYTQDEEDPGKFRMQLLQEGKFCAMTLHESDSDDITLILTARPDANSTRVRHICYKLRNGDDRTIELVQQHVIYCGDQYSQLFKPSILSVPQGLLFFAFEESCSTVCGWIIGNEEATRVVSIKTHNVARQVLAVMFQNHLVIFILMPNLLKTYSIR